MNLLRNPSSAVSKSPFLLLMAGAALSGAVLGGCTYSMVFKREEVAARIASAAWMIKREIPAGMFHLIAYERQDKNYAPARVYIEGDGLAWVSPSRPSLDPTPKDPVALQLAAHDNSPNVFWLSRPCQYTGSGTGWIHEDRPCPGTYWTNGRYAPEVIDSYMAALDNIKAMYKIDGFELVGYSGGGTVAAIVAAKRDDVRNLRTVAGNLNPVLHSDIHGVTRLDQSLNPIDFADRLKTIPQHHYVGAQDENVPPAIFNSYHNALGPDAPVKFTYVQDASHGKGWNEQWPGLLRDALPVDPSKATESNGTEPPALIPVTPPPQEFTDAGK